MQASPRPTPPPSAYGLDNYTCSSCQQGACFCNRTAARPQPRGATLGQGLFPLRNRRGKSSETEFTFRAATELFKSQVSRTKVRKEDSLPAPGWEPKEPGPAGAEGSPLPPNRGAPEPGRQGAPFPEAGRDHKARKAAGLLPPGAPPACSSRSCSCSCPRPRPEPPRPCSGGCTARRTAVGSEGPATEPTALRPPPQHPPPPPHLRPPPPEGEGGAAAAIGCLPTA